MEWFLALIKIGKILPAIEKMYNRVVDYLEDQKLIELGELRQYRETAIQKEIKKKRADDKRRAAIEQLLIDREERNDSDS